MMRNRFRVLFTVVVFGTFLVVQWNCNDRVKNMQQRQVMTMSTTTDVSRQGAASNQPLSSWILPVSTSKNNHTISLALDKRQSSNKTVGIHKASNYHTPATPSIAKIDQDRHTIMYSNSRSDRTGAALQDMLAAHAFCYARNWTYGGACEPRIPSQDLPLDVMENQKAQQEMIQALGLDKVLPFACPVTVDGTHNHTSHSNDTHDILMARGGTYMNKGTKVFTSKWLKYIRSIVMQNGRLREHRQLRQMAETKAGSPLLLRVAVHIRRGDINPCYPYFKARYLTNSYYLNVLDRYLPEINKNNKKWPARNNDSPPLTQVVSIYSERENFEGWDQFTMRNYSMHLDTHLIDDVFYALVRATMAICKH
jgi:hypothetical protein